MDILGGSLGRGCQTRVGLSATAIFSVFTGYFFGKFLRNDLLCVGWGVKLYSLTSESLEMRSALLYSDTQSVVSFSVIPKCVTLIGISC